MSIVMQERIYFELMDEQKLEKAEEIAKLKEEESKLGTELENAKRKFKADISRVQAKTHELWQEIRNGQESRVVDCDVELQGNMLHFSFDGELVKERPADPDEVQKFQKNLFDE